MSLRTVVSTSSAPAAIGPYSQAVVANKKGNIVFVSGQIGMNPANGQIEAKDVEGQTKQALSNLVAVLKAAGATPADVVKTTVLLSTMDDYAAVNTLYANTFSGAAPARAAYACKGLPKGALVEIEAVAVVSDGASSTDAPSILQVVGISALTSALVIGAAIGLRSRM
jgi:2-iminobutanoate/2-iminopropanoate deaminase